MDTLVVHCTASPDGTDLTVKQIDAMHRAQGWAQIGYHYVIRLDGTVEPGRPESVVGAHVAGHNTGSIGISYVGGLERKTLKPKDTRTPAQKAAIERLLADLVSRYPITRILGHRDFSPDKDGDGLIEPREWIKVCPCYDAGPEHTHLLRKRAA
ncbi:N-acetylmuramoyl-L-alanine amidase [Enterovirga sp. DB1703]|uniref:N-acetylmuramoyl-L-alanine amidase n=1 Tax=Enterovirga aerilata TaxID=2730920 RepID=A0A849IFT1_9HYPH|nr:N-acetylmuramoyl-L-alanine amidase [Enterovirga sp. DB1703]